MQNRRWHLILSIAPLLIGLIALWQGISQYQATGSVVFFGDDTFAHLETINWLKNGEVHLSLGNPILLQWLVLKLSTLLQADIVATYSIFALLSLPAMIVTMGIFASRVFNPLVGALTSFLLAFVSVQPVQTYQDGSIPNIYAIGVIFPLALLLSYVSATSTKLGKKVIYGLLAFVLSVAIFFTHHLSSLVVGIIVFCAAIIFSIWLFSHLKKSRWLALLPPMLFILLALVLFEILRPQALLRLVSLVGAFQNTFPWFTFAPVPETRYAWDAIRYGNDLSGAIFQTAVVAIPLAIWKAWQEKVPGKAFLWLVIICWITLYWLGSLTPLSVEPDRLARDFALPGSLVAAYCLWWLTTQFPTSRFRLAIYTFLTVFAISAAFSANLRYKLMHNHPTIAYSSQDKEIATMLAQQKKEVAVYSSNYFWQTIAQSHNYSFRTVSTPSEARRFIDSSKNACIVQVHYKVPIAGQQPDPDFANPVISNSTIITTTYETPARVLFLSCHADSNPSPNSSQNI